MRWEKGREQINDMANAQPPALDRVQPDREHADRSVRQVRAHLATAAQAAGGDPSGAYGITGQQVIEDLPKAIAIVALAGQVLDQMSLI